MSKRLPRSSRSILVLVLIGAIAIGLSVASYQYSLFTSREITRIAAGDIISNAEIQAYDIANNLKNKVGAVSSNLILLSSNPAIQNQDMETAKKLFSNAQKSTSDITSSYFWVDKNGKLLWADAFENQTIYNQYAGADRSFRPYFSHPRETLEPYFSALIESVDQVPRLYIANPVILNSSENNNNPLFNGVVVSAIDAKQLGQFLQSQLSPKFESMFGMTDRNGTILYSSNTTYIGKPVFGDKFQAILPAEIRGSFNSFLRDSLSGNAGSGEITYQGNTSTIAYQPVSFGGQDLFAVAYIVTPHKFGGVVEPLIDQQRNFNLVIIASIAAVAVAIAYFVLIWNRRLSEMVESKTAELKQANKSVREALEELKVHDRMQREFINVAAHELRTPTQAIIGYSDLFYLRPEGREEAMKAIARNAERLERLTSNILDVARIEGHKLHLNKGKFNLSEVVASAIADSKRGIDDDGNIKFEYNARNVVVEADRERISQVISNLLSNAVKFTKQGTIYISEENKDGKVEISVRDTGAGIDSEIISGLFTKFASKSQRGTGLGLFISKSIIEAHGGRIWGENNPDGRGATFTFTLPIQKPHQVLLGSS
ncbi:MAG: sensor histidine kinase [Thermoproteota archaeon]|nr:sensor histidine kinase [Thermoproteota archaeon]